MLGVPNWYILDVTSGPDIGKLTELTGHNFIKALFAISYYLKCLRKLTFSENVYSFLHRNYQKYLNLFIIS